MLKAHWLGEISVLLSITKWISCPGCRSPIETIQAVKIGTVTIVEKNRKVVYRWARGALRLKKEQDVGWTNGKHLQ